MSTLPELVRQRELLEMEIARLRKAERDDAIAKVRALMVEYDLTLVDLGKVLRVHASRRGSSSAGSRVAAKYRDPATGDTWSGRGLMPKWLRAKVDAGQSKESFAV